MPEISKIRFVNANLEEETYELKDIELRKMLGIINEEDASEINKQPTKITVE